MTSPSNAAPVSSALSAALRQSRSGARRPPWRRLAVGGALLAIAVQVLVMAQLAQHQVQRGVQLRQALAVEKAERAAVARAAAKSLVRTAAASPGSADSAPAYVLY